LTNFFAVCKVVSATAAPPASSVLVSDLVFSRRRAAPPPTILLDASAKAPATPVASCKLTVPEWLKSERDCRHSEYGLSNLGLHK
jgi:hypothetical protein